MGFHFENRFTPAGQEHIYMFPLTANESTINQHSYNYEILTRIVDNIRNPFKITPRKSLFVGKRFPPVRQEHIYIRLSSTLNILEFY